MVQKQPQNTTKHNTKIHAKPSNFRQPNVETFIGPMAGSKPSKSHPWSSHQPRNHSRASERCWGCLICSTIPRRAATADSWAESLCSCASMKVFRLSCTHHPPRLPLVPSREVRRYETLLNIVSCRFACTDSARRTQKSKNGLLLTLLQYPTAISIICS